MLGHGATTNKQGRRTFSNNGKGGTHRRESLCSGLTSSSLWLFLTDKIHTTVTVTLQINVPRDECIGSDIKPSRGEVCRHSASFVQVDDNMFTELTLC